MTAPGTIQRMFPQIVAPKLKSFSISYVRLEAPFCTRRFRESRFTVKVHGVLHDWVPIVAVAPGGVVLIFSSCDVP
jgi:hypothetical protein